MAANHPDPGRILSVQSHVVTGYVGNRSATFPLQLLGWEVDVINTTQLSNHTGYKRFGGMRLDAEHLQSVFEGMDQNGLLRYGRMLSGYTPSPSALSKLAGFVQRLLTINPKLVYLLDPVMGDMGRGYYVDKDCLSIYQQLLGAATIICPNQFEAQELSGVKITSLSTLNNVIRALHDRGTPNVIITSVNLPANDLEALGAKPEGGMVLIGSSKDHSGDFKSWYIQFPELEDYFVGVGDLFSALMLGNYEPKENVNPNRAAQMGTQGRPRTPSATASGRLVETPLARAAELAIASVQSVLQVTQDYIEASPLPDNIDSLDAADQHVEKVRRRELRLVQSRKYIEEPRVQFRAHWFP